MKQPHMFARALARIAVITVLALGVFTPRSADALVNYVKVTKTYSQFSAAATSKTLEIYTTRSKEHIFRVIVVKDIDVGGGNADAGLNVTAATIEVGKSGATTKYVEATNVFTGVSNGWANAINPGNEGVELSGTVINAILRTTGANTSNLQSGQLSFYVYTSAAL